MFKKKAEKKTMPDVIVNVWEVGVDSIPREKYMGTISLRSGGDVYRTLAYESALIYRGQFFVEHADGTFEFMRDDPRQPEVVEQPEPEPVEEEKVPVSLRYDNGVTLIYPLVRPSLQQKVDELMEQVEERQLEHSS